MFFFCITNLSNKTLRQRELISSWMSFIQVIDFKLNDSYENKIYIMTIVKIHTNFCYAMKMVTKKFHLYCSCFIRLIFNIILDKNILRYLLNELIKIITNEVVKCDTWKRNHLWVFKMLFFIQLQGQIFVGGARGALPP